MITNGILGVWSDFTDRYVQDSDRLGRLSDNWKELGLKIVLTSGSFDLIHTGHARYLETAARLGDVLVVGVDSDEKIRARKGPSRPMVPELERLEMLSHIRGVNVVTIKNVDDPKWYLLSVVRPDILIASEGTYLTSQINEIQTNNNCQVIVLQRMAETSTSERIRQFNINAGDEVKRALNEQFPIFLENTVRSIQATTAARQVTQG